MKELKDLSEKSLKLIEKYNCLVTTKCLLKLIDLLQALSPLPVVSCNLQNDFRNQKTLWQTWGIKFLPFAFDEKVKSENRKLASFWEDCLNCFKQVLNKPEDEEVTDVNDFNHYEIRISISVPKSSHFMLNFEVVTWKEYKKLPASLNKPFYLESIVDLSPYFSDYLNIDREKTPKEKLAETFLSIFQKGTLYKISTDSKDFSDHVVFVKNLYEEVQRFQETCTCFVDLVKLALEEGVLKKFKELNNELEKELEGSEEFLRSQLSKATDEAFEVSLVK